MHFKKGKLVILSGPSGVGKDTVLDEWMARNPNVTRVVAYTTRAPRPGERPGIDYHFVTDETFARLATVGAFLEHKCVYGNSYATPLSDVEAALAEGKIAVLKLDVKGALTVMTIRPDATTIFLLPPNMEELQRRIVARGTDTPDMIERRLANAKSEVSLSRHYQHKVVNESVSASVEQIDEIALAA